MPSEIVIALCSLAGTLFGSISGIIISNRLVNYRIEQLEKKVDKHNNIVERMVIMERDIKTQWHVIDGIRGKGN